MNKVGRILDALEVPEVYRAPIANPNGGRPSSYSPEVAMRICERMANGELCVDVCAEEGMPHVGTLHRWREAHAGFRAAYARARDMQAHACAEMAVRSARKATTEDAAAARVRFDGDRWLASKLAPKDYGDRIQQDVTGTLTLADLVRASITGPGKTGES